MSRGHRKYTYRIERDKEFKVTKLNARDCFEDETGICVVKSEALNAK